MVDTEKMIQIMPPKMCLHFRCTHLTIPFAEKEIIPIYSCQQHFPYFTINEHCGGSRKSGGGKILQLLKHSEQTAKKESESCACLAWSHGAACKQWGNWNEDGS